MQFPAGRQDGNARDVFFTTLFTSNFFCKIGIIVLLLYLTNIIQLWIN
jgi:hypothetical protein